jgi:hypothetical protein
MFRIGWVSEPEIGQVAVADRDPGAGHQETVDRGHQAAEKAGGGREAEGRNFRHFGPHSGLQGNAAALLEIKLCIPDTRRNLFVCIAAICILQCTKNRVIGDSDGGRVGPCPTKKTAKTGGLLHLHFVDHSNSNLILRSALRARLEGWPHARPMVRDAASRLLTMRLCCIAQVFLRRTPPHIRRHPEERPLGRVSKDGRTCGPWFETPLRGSSP